MASHTPPPSYRAHASEPIDLLDGIQATVRRDRVRDGANISVVQTEADRLHRFILFVLAVDYQRHTAGHIGPLSAEDSQHFVILSYQLQNLARSNRHTPLSDAERSTPEPYFALYLYEPCRYLGIPFDYMVVILTRFTRFLGRNGRYRGFMFGLVQSQRDGVERVAEKLWMDENVLIPRLLPDCWMGRDLIDGLRGAKEMYFERIVGVERSVAVGSRVIYTLNRQGMAREGHHARVSSIIDRLGAVSPARWAKRAKEYMSCILARRGQSPKEAPSEKPARQNNNSTYLHLGLMACGMMATI
ncbi:hypothetical protein Tdes44962_MAKER04571 [Teratosphaeria destructans]|uniref:Uncharacterized protein n=1 Tax=Teratosphaeria destructans TaxID=418781 RepID=A0A9W7SM22_9PEZI|nr:hypothetical protein Tdes44962_MAKER04571 [Teratosphaeria destructans]